MKQKPLFPYKYGDVAHGRWDWAVGASARVPETQPTMCVAITNFHGCISAGYDPQKLAAMMAEAPVLIALLEALHTAAVNFLEHGKDRHLIALDTALFEAALVIDRIKKAQD